MTSPNGLLSHIKQPCCAYVKSSVYFRIHRLLKGWMYKQFENWLSRNILATLLRLVKSCQWLHPFQMSRAQLTCFRGVIMTINWEALIFFATISKLSKLFVLRASGSFVEILSTSRSRAGSPKISSTKTLKKKKTVNSRTNNFYWSWHLQKKI